MPRLRSMEISLASRALDTPRSGLSPGLHGSCAIGAPVSLSRLSMLRYENAYPIDSLVHRLAAVVVDVEVDNKREREREVIRGKKRRSGSA